MGNSGATWLEATTTTVETFSGEGALDASGLTRPVPPHRSQGPRCGYKDPQPIGYSRRDGPRYPQSYVEYGQWTTW